MTRAGVRSILRNSGYVISGHVVTTLIAFGYAVALAHILGQHLYGILAFGFAWYLTAIAFSYLGLDVVLGREIGLDRSNSAVLAGSTLALRISSALILAILSSVAGAAIEPDPNARALLVIFGVALFSRAIWQWCGSVFSAFEDTRRGLLIDLACRPVEPAIVIIFLLSVSRKNIIMVGVVHSAVWFLQASIGVYLVARHITPISFHAARSHASRLLRAGMPGALYALTVVWFTQTPIVLFRHVVGTGDSLSQFALAVQMLGYLLIIPYFVGSVALPVLSRSAARQDGKTRTAALASLIVIPAVGAVLGLLALWLAPPAVRLIFGTRFQETGHILGEAVWLLIPMSLAISLQQIQFSSRRRQHTGAISAILGMAAMATLFTPLTHAWGYHGALLATGIGMTVWAGGLVVAVLARE